MVSKREAVNEPYYILFPIDAPSITFDRYRVITIPSMNVLQIFCIYCRMQIAKRKQLFTEMYLLQKRSCKSPKKHTYG